MEARDLGRLRILAGRGGTATLRERERVDNFKALQKSGLVTVEAQGSTRDRSWVIALTADGRKEAR